MAGEAFSASPLRPSPALHPRSAAPAPTLRAREEARAGEGDPQGARQHAPPATRVFRGHLRGARYNPGPALPTPPPRRLPLPRPFVLGMGMATA